MWLSIEVTKLTLVGILEGKNRLELEKSFKYERLQVGDIIEIYNNNTKHLNQFLVIITAKEAEKCLEFDVGLLPNLGIIEMFDHINDTDDSPEVLAIPMRLELLKHNRDPMVTTVAKPQKMLDIFRKHNAMLGDVDDLPKLHETEIYKLYDPVKEFGHDEDNELKVAYESEEQRCEQAYDNWAKAVEECHEYISKFRGEFEYHSMCDYHGFDANGIYKLTVGEFKYNWANKTTSTNCCYDIDNGKTATMVAKTGKDFIQNLQICTGPDYDCEYYIEKLWFDLKSNTYVVGMGRR